MSSHRPAARTKRVTKADISFLESIDLSSQSRSSSHISSYSALDDDTKAASQERARLAQVSGTPVKPSGTHHPSYDLFVRRKVHERLAHELLDRQWQSTDLVEHAFGKSVTLDLAARILLFLLHHKVVKVYAKSESQVQREISRSEWPDACVHAALSARVMANPVADKDNPKVLGDKLKENYKWVWDSSLETGSESGVANFFNVVGVLAFLATNVVEQEQSRQSRVPHLHFITMPRPNYPLPLSSSKQDSRPDVIGLATDAFVSKSHVEALSRDQEFLTQSSPLNSIRASRFSSVLNHFTGLMEPQNGSPAIPSSSSQSQSNVESNMFESASAFNDDVFTVGSSSQTPSSHPFDLDAADGPTIADILGPATSNADLSEATKSLVGDLREKLNKILDVLTERKDSTVELSTETINKLDYTHVDLSRVSWPGLHLTVEAKMRDMSEAIFQALNYMRQQHCTQPYLRFVIGLAVTKDRVTLLRSDSVGVERCALKKHESRGVLEIIRLALGLTVAEDKDLGVHPAFTFRTVEIRSKLSEENQTFSVSKKREADFISAEPEPKRRRGHTPDASSKRKTVVPVPTTFRFREAAFITLRDTQRRSSEDKDGAVAPDATGETRYYLDYLLDDRGSLIGRTTRVWCAYRETVGEESAKLCADHALEPAQQSCIGPYALKFFCVDVESEAFKKNIEQKAQQKGVKHVLFPTDVWHLGRILNVVRDFDDDGDSLLKSVADVIDRMEVVSVSQFKRTLAQFKSFGEVIRALIDVFKAIESLAKAGYIHRDVSLGNVLLAQEEPSLFPTPSTRTVDLVDGRQYQLVLIRREVECPANAYGYLHDLDMAASILPSPVHAHNLNEDLEQAKKTLERRTHGGSPKPEVTTDTQDSGKTQKAIKGNTLRRFRTGTTPFMSTEVMLGKQHSVYDELQSTFLVLYLFFFSYNGPGKVHYPQLPLEEPIRWPAVILKWADGPSFPDLGALKKQFFAQQNTWLSEPFQSNSVPHWHEADKMQLDPRYLFPLLNLYRVLWTAVAGSTDFVPRSSAKLGDAIDALDAVLRDYPEEYLLQSCHK